MNLFEIECLILKYVSCACLIELPPSHAELPLNETRLNAKTFNDMLNMQARKKKE
jgi:hypothetical protein